MHTLHTVHTMHALPTLHTVPTLSFEYFWVTDECPGTVFSRCHHHVILMSFAGGSTRGVWREKREMRWCELWWCKMYTDARCADVRCFGPPISSSACGVQGFVKGCHRTFAGQGAAEVWRCLRSLLAPPFGRGRMQIQHRFRLSWPYGLASPSLFTHVF